MNISPFEMWREDVEPVLQSKAEEFQMFGYTSADQERVWNCTMEKLKKREESHRIHVLVNSILTLSLSDFMNQITVASYKESAKYYSTEANLDDLLGEIETHTSTKRHLT
ncbi:post-transcriptional regulator [Salibacterium aidingense]|uniref:post-transcriptional regulator n=1 Tax=Salibacterium aidingense TaxID=384933 RepID=UPI0004208C09|nr:post-transcriptional regulator [Salibacterium aidingense]